ncbi:MAG: acylphosphatase [Synergistaceae bacterium]|jgi:acylphosphatase|nr:acylphosphatase [Synergistaceae bacterium]
MKRRRVTVSGRVQGVGFRWNARSRANELGLTGWVRNLPDRRVEICFQGQDGAVEEMEDWCRVGPQFSYVRGVFVIDEAPVEYEEGFEIR